MADVLTIRVDGLGGALKTLEQLPPVVVSKGGGPVRAALRKAAVVIQKEEKLNLQKIIDEPNIGGQNESTGLLMKNIVVSRGKMPAGQNGEIYRVRVRNKRYPEQKGKGSSTAANARRLEYGTERRKPYPFIRSAFEAKKNEAVQVFVNEVTKGIRRIQRKLERQNRVKT